MVIQVFTVLWTLQAALTPLWMSMETRTPLVRMSLSKYKYERENSRRREHVQSRGGLHDFVRNGVQIGTETGVFDVDWGIWLWVWVLDLGFGLGVGMGRRCGYAPKISKRVACRI